MNMAELPRRVVCFDTLERDSSINGKTALMMMPLRFTTGDFARFAWMCRVEAEEALNELQVLSFVVHDGNKWQRLGDSLGSVKQYGATSKRMEFIWALPPVWISAVDFAIDALTHKEVARQFLIDKWTRRESEKSQRVVKVGGKSEKTHVFRRLA